MEPLVVAAVLAASQAVPDWKRFPLDEVPKPWPQVGYNQLIWVRSPNKNARPSGVEVDTIVIHATVNATLSGVAEWFHTPRSQVSAHYTIGKDGSICKQLSVFERAWHAGRSLDAEGRGDLNSFSIGIELVNLNDGKDPYPDAQLEALDNLISMLRRRYFNIRQLVSHEFIAVPQGRKSDPRNFPWERLKGQRLPMFFGPNPKAAAPGE